MTYHVESIKRVRFHTENVASFAVDLTTNISTFTDIPVLEGSSLTLDMEMLDPMIVRQNMYDHNEKYVGPKKATFTFEVGIGTPTTKAADAVTATQPAIGLLLQSIMGGVNAGTGRVIDSAGSVSSLNVDGDPGVDGGAAIGWINSNGKLEVREVENYSGAGNIIALKLALSTAPITNATIIGCISYYLDNHTSSSVLSLQTVIDGLGEGSDFEDSWGLLGGQIPQPMTITFENGALPKLGFTVEYADWDNGDDLNYTPAAITPITYSDHNEVVIVDSEFRCGVVGAGTLANTEYHITEFTLEPGFKFAPVRSPGGTNNIVQWMAMPDNPAIKGSFTLPYEGQTFTDARASKTDMFITFQVGSSITSGAIMFSVPTMQIVDVKRVDVDGIMSQQVFFEGRLDSDVSGDTTALALSPFRIHVF